MTQELQGNLKFLRNYYSKKTKTNLTLTQTITQMATELRERHDPVRKSERFQKRQTDAKPTKKPSTLPGKSPSPTEPPEWVTEVIPLDSRPIPTRIKHKLNLRDKRQCTYKYHNGKRCEHTRHIDNHHILLVANGGLSTLNNLQTLCSFHHAFIHKQERRG